MNRGLKRILDRTVAFLVRQSDEILTVILFHLHQEALETQE